MRWNEEPLEPANLPALLIAFAAYFNGYLKAETVSPAKIISANPINACGLRARSDWRLAGHTLSGPRCEAVAQPEYRLGQPASRAQRKPMCLWPSCGAREKPSRK